MNENMINVIMFWIWLPGLENKFEWHGFEGGGLERHELFVGVVLLDIVNEVDVSIGCNIGLYKDKIGSECVLIETVSIGWEFAGDVGIRLIIFDI